MTHTLNPTFQRIDIEGRREVDGAYQYPTICFISCSCGWHHSVEGTLIAENAWIDHMKNPDAWLGE